MIVDLERNDLARVARPAASRSSSSTRSRTGPGCGTPARTVAARLAAGLGALDVLAALLPGGSVTGAPKTAACALLAGLEPVGRGPSMGAFGLLWPGGLDLGLTIRTVAADAERIHLWAGGGITWGSDPAARGRRGARQGGAAARRAGRSLSGAPVLLLRLLQRRARRHPGGAQHRVAGRLVGVADRQVVVHDDGDHPVRGPTCAAAAAWRCAPVDGHDCRASPASPVGQAVAGEPGEGVGAAVLGTSGQVDHLALLGALQHQRDAGRQRRVVDGCGEERSQSLRRPSTCSSRCRTSASTPSTSKTASGLTRRQTDGPAAPAAAATAGPRSAAGR